jgi:1,4-alpha-glucan branching enzyme
MRDLNRLYAAQPALYEHDFDFGGFEWLEVNDVEQSVFAYMRFADNRGDFVVVVCNFTPAVRYNYRVGVPHKGYYRELLNSDADTYGGSGLGNMGGVQSEDVPWNVHGQSLSLTVPPLGILILKLDQPPVGEGTVEEKPVTVQDVPPNIPAN